MELVTRETGIGITLALAVFFGGCGLLSCIGGIGTLLGLGTSASVGSAVPPTSAQVPPGAGWFGILCGVVLMTIPVVSYFVLVRGKHA